MRQDEALQILKSGASAFLTGEPGSGKSYIASRFVGYLRREGIAVSVTASTGIAAAQLGGMTVHAWSGIGTRSTLSRSDLDFIARNRRVTDRIKKARVLIIDEVSMLSRQTLTAVSQVCQYVRKSPAPFGGIQTVFVGDFFQLPPVVRRDEHPGAETESQDEADASPFAYASRAWRDLDPAICYLTEQHRQTDREFSELLGAIRSNACRREHLEILGSRKPTRETLPHGITRLYTHNMDVDRINYAELMKLPGEPKVFLMSTMGDKVLSEGLKRGCLSPEELALKLGAVVMFTKNDPEGRFVNGTLGVVCNFDRDGGWPVVETKSGFTVTAKPAEWKVQEDDAVKAGIEQVPLRLAWAITVHKSQGMSLDAALMDLSNAFEYGQGYVALSRVRALGGLHLLGWNERALRVHPEALAKDADFREASEGESDRLAAQGAETIEALRVSNLRDMKGLPAGPAAASHAATAAQPAPTADADHGRIANAYKKWSEEEETDVSTRYKRGESVKAIAAAVGRQEGGIRARLVKLGLIMK
ncbi:AAA family ATPase [Rhodomicrobium vannielii ATCC 17100]|uniref:ATP-dependent DNA helicase n=1 Tax=Rhodomicrobium vannielii TaxID=1069 RepID=UPI00191A73F4|nr:DEAD/DEAH box helicase [Rhodomicrobium vannielii]MBJ7534158.1 AAA family ATPase [Rhodomicrobium vannielii ATCC 17100]